MKLRKNRCLKRRSSFLLWPYIYVYFFVPCKQDVNYYHFDFHHECKESSEPMMNYLKDVVLSQFLEEIKIFHQTNYIVSEKSLDGLLETKKLV